MGLVPDQGAVAELAAVSADQAFGDERGREVRVAVRIMTLARCVCPPRSIIRFRAGRACPLAAARHPFD
jgi:hypothetical protein